MLLLSKRLKILYFAASRQNKLIKELWNTINCQEQILK